MNLRSCPIPVVLPLLSSLTLVLAGCSDSFNAGPMAYVESDRIVSELKDKPELQKAVRGGIAQLFGADPTHIKVPENSRFFYNGGIRLANYMVGDDGKKFRVRVQKLAGGMPEVDGSGNPITERAEGGYALYRKHCVHCHGVSGAGDGPTALFLFPRPRDYRKGMFKFTSTPNGAKPTRADLRKTILNGLHGTSMPAFDALMSEVEVEQVLDYTIFLSIRGEVESALVDEAAVSGEITPEVLADVSKAVLNKWKAAESQVINPPVPRTPSSRESVERGKALFLSLNKTGNKVDCTSCHGPQAIGNGPSIVPQDVFNRVVFGGKISRQFKLVAGELALLQTLTDLEAKNESKPTKSILLEAFKKDTGTTGQEKIDDLVSKTGYVETEWGKVGSFETLVENLLADLENKMLVQSSLSLSGTRYHAYIDSKTGKLWNDSLDEWGNPVRPANLNRGIYKGGRRPLDLYWRIAKGINGSKMMAHFPAIEAEKIWDLVNFVLALPYEPDLLEGATLPPAPGASPTPAVANR